MMANVSVNDKSPKLAVKDAILVRSGNYIYSRDEVLSWGLKPKVDKPFYRVYRPAGVVVAAKDLFNMVPVTKDHPPVDIDASNFSTFASGMTGGPIEAVTLENGEIALKGKIGFFTRDAFDHYNAGNLETSAGIENSVYEVENADEVGYDFRLSEIISVNHIAVVQKGRGGSSVKVLDAMPLKQNFNGINIDNGGIKMSGKIKGGILQRLGIVKVKDENFKLSTVVLDSVKKVHSLDADGLTKEIESVMGHINTLGDSEIKEVLVGMVTDCFKNPVEVIAAQDKVAVKLDELYVACQDADAQVVQVILDSASKKVSKETSKEEDEEASVTNSKETSKETVSSKDSVDIEEIVKRAVTAAVNDNISSKVDEAVKKALGLDDLKSKKIEGQDVNVIDSITSNTVINDDGSYLVKGLFGSR